MLDASKLRNFLLFDSKGRQINLLYDKRQNLMRGTVYLPEVSVGLIESITIHLVERIIVNGQERLLDPRCTSTVHLELDRSGDYSLFVVDNPYEASPEIKVLGDSVSDYTAGQIPSFLMSGDKSWYENDQYNVETANATSVVQSTMQVNCMLRPTTAGVHGNALSVYLRRNYDDGKTPTTEPTTECIIQLDLYCEAVGEDERLVKRLADFGEYISDKEEYIFRNSDINEDNPDYKALNLKRKEFLIELHNIKPYLSSYKGIVNILNLFDYPDLNLKEYWLDTTSGRMFTEDVNNYERQQLHSSAVYNRHYKKTTFFGLFYQFNVVEEDSYDEDGLPILRDNFLFSNEEIIIKLFGLKQWIKDREIGGISSIIDIVGEWTFFNKYSVNQWTDSYEYEIIDETTKIPTFTVGKSIAYIEDLRPRLENWNSCRLPRHKKISEKTYLDDYNTCKIGWFGHSQYELDNARGHDEPGIPVGAIIPVTNTTFDLRFKEARVQYRALTNTSTTYDIRWNNLASFDQYEVEWAIKHVSSQWSMSKVTAVTERIVEFTVPYVGYYSITLQLRSYGNQSNRLTKHSIIEVKTREPDFLCYYRFIDQALQRYGTNALPFKNVHTSWGSVVYDNQKYTVDEAKIKYCTTTLAEYRRLHALRDPHVRFDGLQYKTLNNIQWSQYMYHTWENLLYRHVRLSKFIIKSFSAGGWLSVNNDQLVLPSNLNECEYSRVVDLLSYAFPYYQFIVRHYADNKFIECISKQSRPHADVVCAAGIDVDCNHTLDKTRPLPLYLKDYAPIIKDAESVILPRSTEYPFTMENVRIYHDWCDCPVLTPVFFTIDNCAMVGKTRCTWTLRLNDTVVVQLSDSNYFCYYFTSPGQYSLSLTIIDTNGNSRTITKERLINVHSSNKFKQLEYAK